MTIDDVINAKKLDFITKVYRQDEYTHQARLGFSSKVCIVTEIKLSFKETIEGCKWLSESIRVSDWPVASQTYHGRKCTNRQKSIFPSISTVDILAEFYD